MLHKLNVHRNVDALRRPRFVQIMSWRKIFITLIWHCKTEPTSGRAERSEAPESFFRCLFELFVLGAFAKGLLLMNDRTATPRVGIIRISQSDFSIQY